MEGNQVVCEFKSNALGMGVFHITPQKDKLYTATIENSEIEATLPKSKASGLTISVNHLTHQTILSLRYDYGLRKS